MSAVDNFLAANTIRCERHRCSMQASACEARREWDPVCVGCARGPAEKPPKKAYCARCQREISRGTLCGTCAMHARKGAAPPRPKAATASAKPETKTPEPETQGRKDETMGSHSGRGRYERAKCEGCDKFFAAKSLKESADGVSLCPACYSELTTTSKESKPDHTATGAPPPASGVDPAPSGSPAPSFISGNDLSRLHDDAGIILSTPTKRDREILEAVRKIAVNERRTLNDQILWMLEEGCK